SIPPRLSISLLFYFRRHPPTSTLFPYTTLFRSRRQYIIMHTRNDNHFLLASRDIRMTPSLFELTFTKPYYIELYPSAHTSVERRSEEHTSELQSRFDLVCRLLLEKKKKIHITLI